GNAIKFTEHGEITLIAEKIDDFTPPGMQAAQPAIRIHVRDTGIGIKPEHLTQLFEPFRQVDSRQSAGQEGTGLGLAICDRLATLMGGLISVESQWGQGSTFTVTLPLQSK